MLDKLPDPNQQISLREDIKLSVANPLGEVECRGDIYLDLLPLPQIRIRTRNCNLNPKDLVAGTAFRVGLLDENRFFNAQIINYSTSGECSFVPNQNNLLIKDPGRLERYSFYIFNLHNTLFDLDLESEDLKVRIENRKDLDVVLDELNSKGGYGLTHLAHLEHTCEKAISTKKIHNDLKMLWFFLSFVNGSWISISMPHSRSNEQEIFEEWTFYTCSPWKNFNRSFYDDHHPQICQDLFANFEKLWKHPTWRQALNDSIYWYVGSNLQLNGVDSALILSQCALELLGWTYLVKSKDILKKSTFKSMPASEIMNVLLSNLGISIAIPDRCARLQGIKIGNSVSTNGPEVITYVRNSLVHPTKDVTFSVHDYFEAWNLSQWYIEMIFLRLLDYNKKYSNRLIISKFKGIVENLPWT